MALQKTSQRIPWTNVRWLTALMGVTLLIFGQFQIAGSTSQAGPSTILGDWLTNTLHLGITDISNVLRGIPLLLLGGILLAVSLRGLDLLPPRQGEFTQDKPLAIRWIASAWPFLLAGMVLFTFLLFQLSRLNYGFYSIFLWILPLLTFAVLAAVGDHRRGIDLSPHISRHDLVWLIGLLAAGLLIGACRLQGWPDQLMGDEGNFWTVARDIASGTFHPAIFANGVYSFPILSSVLQAGIMKLFGVTLWGWRMASVLPGIATVAPLYLLARDLFNKKVAVAASIVLITSPYFLAFARLGYNNIQALFISTLALYWLYAGLQRNSHCLTLLAGMAAGLGFYTYFSARGALVMAILFIALMGLTKRLPWRRALAAVVILLMGFFLVSAPYFVYGLHQDAQTMGFKTFESAFFNVFNGSQYYSQAELFRYAPVIHLGGNDLFFNPPIYAVLFSQGLIRTLLAFQKPGLITEHYIAFPLAGTIGVIFYLLGLGLTLKHIKEPRHQLLLLWFLTYVVGFSAMNTVPPRHTHMVALIPALALLIGLGLNAVAEGLGHIRSWVRKRTPILLGILLTVVALGGLYDYFVLAPKKYPPQPDQVMSWAALESNGETFIYINEVPSEKDFRPYIVSEFLPSISFQTIPFSQAVEGLPALSPVHKTIVFYPPDLAGSMIPILQKQWGESLIQKAFTSVDGSYILAAGMDTPFVFERDRPVSAAFFEAFLHLPFDIVLVFLLTILGLVIVLPAPHFGSMPAWSVRFWKWFNRPPQPAEVESQEESSFFPEASSPHTQTSLAAQLPDWVEELNKSIPPVKTARLVAHFKSVHTAEGRHFYFHIHIPKLKLFSTQRSNEQGVSLPPIHFPNGAMLILSVFLAIAGQFAITSRWTILGAALYGLCAAGLIVWARRNPKWMGLFTGQLRILPRAELILAVLLFAGIAFTRFYDLGHRVYGLEADETKWTAQSWYSAILHVDQGEFASAHYKYLPVSFWVRSFFLRLFGLNFLSARIESACLSLLSGLFLYFLVRRLTKSPPTAWLATALYSFSFVELNASHQALHNTTVEVWMMAGLFLLILALQERKYGQFLMAGLVLAAGMLTYETYFPTPLLAAIFLIGVAIYRIVRKRESLSPGVKRALVFFLPIVLLFFIYIQKYIASQSYHFQFLAQSTANGASLGGLFPFLLKNGTDLLQTLFIRVVWTDSLIYWPGPFLNPWLIAFVVIGLIYNLLNLRRPYLIFIPLWFLANILYAPILLGSVWPRVLYTSLALMLIWAAMGLWTFLAALRSWADGLKMKFATPIFVLLVVALLVKDYSIFTTSLLDPLDRQKRRELADLTARSAATVPMVLFPYETNQNDSVFVESHVLKFSVAGACRTGLEASNYYQVLPFEQTLPALFQDRTLPSLDLVYDKTASTMVAERSTSIQVIHHCYPAASVKTNGRFFIVYHFDSKTLAEPACYQAPPPNLISPAEGSTLPASPSPVVQWDSRGVHSTSYSLSVDRKVANNYWIEAEDTFAGPNWSASSEFVNGFNGGGFLYDNWDAGAAQYSLPVAEAGQYRVWIRSYKRETNDQSNYLEIQGKKTEFASNQSPLNTWVWEDMGTYTLPAGPLPMALTRIYGKDPEYSVFIDTILVTPDLSDPPERVGIWENVLNTGEVASAAAQYTFSQPLPPGEYRWQVRLFDGTRLIDSTGARGVASPQGSFTIVSK